MRNDDLELHDLQRAVESIAMVTDKTRDELKKQLVKWATDETGPETFDSALHGHTPRLPIPIERKLRYLKRLESRGSELRNELACRPIRQDEEESHGATTHAAAKFLEAEMARTRTQLGHRLFEWITESEEQRWLMLRNAASTMEYLKELESSHRALTQPQTAPPSHEHVSEAKDTVYTQDTSPPQGWIQA